MPMALGHILDEKNAYEFMTLNNRYKVAGVDAARAKGWWKWPSPGEDLCFFHFPATLVRRAEPRRDETSRAKTGCAHVHQHAVLHVAGAAGATGVTGVAGAVWRARRRDESAEVHK